MPAHIHGPPPGFSLPNNPATLDRPNLTIPPLNAGSLSSLSSVGPSASSFGTNGLSLKGPAGGGSLSLSSSLKPSSGLSLSSLASSHLSSTGGQNSLSSLAASAGGQNSLSSLAASTGGQNSLSLRSSTGPQLNSLSKKASSDSRPSLSHLASSHLEPVGSAGSAFIIPSIFGKRKEELGPVTARSDQPEINLMSALKLNTDEGTQKKETETRSTKPDKNTPDINILVPENGFQSIRSILRRRTQTPFSFTLTR